MAVSPPDHPCEELTCWVGPMLADGFANREALRKPKTWAVQAPGLLRLVEVGPRLKPKPFLPLGATIKGTYHR